VDNPFFLAAQNPLSTFSIAVDTASYTNVRRFLSGGQLPPQDAVRIEDFVNYFTYDYPKPEGEHPVALSTEVAACPWNPRHQLVRIGLQAKRFDLRELPPRNLVFLVDTSGSMAEENRLPLLKKSLALLTEQLTARDRVAIVAYAGSAGLVLPSSPGDRKDVILAAINHLNAEGSTNGGEGIVLAYRVAVENFIRGGANRVILGTDGDFNVGVTSEGELVRLIEEKRKTGVYLTVLGFGMGNLRDRTMEKLAQHGNGQYAYIDSFAEARRVFVEQGATLIPVARDVKVQVEFNPGRVQAYRLIGHENRLLHAQDFNDETKDAGDMGAGHTVTALYEIVPPGVKIDVPAVGPLTYQQPPRPTPASFRAELLTVNVRYTPPEGDQSRLLSRPVPDAERRPTEAASADFRFAAAAAAFGMVLRDSPYKGEATYAGILRLARGALGADPQGHRAEFVGLVEAAQRLAARQGDVR
jgi:Ca-activated chloride channel family protein